MEIREYAPSRDRGAVRTCFVELQDFERHLDPRIPPGEQIADAYLDLTFQRCREFDGVVLVAELDGAVVGFVTVWTRYRSSEPDDDLREHGFVSDLVVLADYRGCGFGRSLLRAAEARAREAGAHALRLSVKAGNDGALALYSAEEFAVSEIHLEKPLVQSERGPVGQSPPTRPPALRAPARCAGARAPAPLADQLTSWGGLRVEGRHLSRGTVHIPGRVGWPKGCWCCGLW